MYTVINSAHSGKPAKVVHGKLERDEPVFETRLKAIKFAVKANEMKLRSMAEIKKAIELENEYLIEIKTRLEMKGDPK